MLCGFGAIFWKTWNSRRAIAPEIELERLEQAQAQIQQPTEPEVVNDNPDFNTNNMNPNVITTFATLVALTVVIIFGSVNYTLDQRYDKILSMLFMRDIVNPFAMTLGVPGLIYAMNQELRNYVFYGFLERVTAKFDAICIN